ADPHFPRPRHHALARRGRAPAGGRIPRLAVPVRRRPGQRLRAPVPAAVCRVARERAGAGPGRGPRGGRLHRPAAAGRRRGVRRAAAARRPAGRRGVLLRRVGAAARLPWTGRGPCLLRRTRGPCTQAWPLPLHRVLRRGPRAGRPAPPARVPAQRCVLARPRLCAPAGTGRPPGVGGDRQGRNRTCADLLVARLEGETMKVAACRYEVGKPADFEAFAARQRALLEQAAAQGVRVAVLPEYLSLELAAIHGPQVYADLHASLQAIQQHRQAWLALFSGLARELGMYIVAGSFLLDIGAGRHRNRADLFAPDGGHQWQDKLQLTGFEERTGVIVPGEALKVVDVAGVRAGISICYDSEFPLPVRAQYEAGARLLLVPSCTDTAAGATRVRVGCLARALENRFFVAQAVTAGDAPWSPALDTNTG